MDDAGSFMVAGYVLTVLVLAFYAGRLLLRERAVRRRLEGARTRYTTAPVAAATPEVPGVGAGGTHVPA